MILAGVSDGVTAFAVAVGLLAVGPIAYLGWRRPIWLVVLIILSIGVPGDLSLPGPAAEATVGDAVSLFAVAVIIARAVLIPARSLSPVLAGLLAVCLLASACVTFVVPDAYTSLAGLVRFTQMFVLVPLATYLALVDESDQRVLVGALIAFGVGQSLIAVYQALTGTGATIFTSPGEQSDARGVGTFDASEVMAVAIITSAAIMAALALALWGSGRTRWLGIASLLPLAAGQIASLSRGAWIAVAAGGFAIALLKDVRRTAIAVGCIVIAAGAAAPFVLASENVVSERVRSLVETPTNPDASVRNRYGLWEASMGIWVDHPVAGVGLRSFPAHRDTYLPLEATAASDIQDPSEGFRQIALESPHNLYFLVLAEQGILGITAYGLLLAALLIFGVRAVRARARDPRPRFDIYPPFAFAMVAWLVSFLVRSLYGDISGATAAFDALMLGAAMTVAFHAGRTRDVRAPSSDESG
jgi:O-antigen ligase